MLTVNIVLKSIFTASYWSLEDHA